MPIRGIYKEDDDMLLTVLSGTVTDQDLLDYYGPVLAGAIRVGGCEMVDGRHVVDLAVSAEGLAAFSAMLWRQADRIPRDRRCAMLAGNDLVHSLFRLWQAEKGALPYPLAVFRDDEAAALRWLRAEGEDPGI